ncbi:hypothetical protein A8F95_02600 [Bacillus wudalianchiensis]|uniref:Uncharacterized protein n=1 Tax=Pseudobacillus wudalianchiensis TaxID=1743143 RepID=A0A1B9B921_9BACI|nr:hypothetical protein A8F95_02600 [Bacillus wudalianchiensis]
MKKFKFFVLQTVLLSVLYVLNFCLDKYLDSPFTRIDLISACIYLLLVALIWKPIGQLYKHFSDIRYPIKVLLSIPAFILPSLLLLFLLSL